MSSIPDHHRASLLRVSDLLEGTSGELFDVAIASLFVAEAFARQLVLLQQGKESDYLAYLTGRAEQPSSAGSLNEQMQQLEQILSTGAGFLVEAGEANVNMAGRIVEMHTATCGAADHIALEDTRAAQIADAAVDHVTENFEHIKQELIRERDEAYAAVAEAGAATSAVVNNQSRSTLTKNVSSQTTEEYAAQQHEQLPSDDPRIAVLVVNNNAPSASTSRAASFSPPLDRNESSNNNEQQQRPTQPLVDAAVWRTPSNTLKQRSGYYSSPRQQQQQQLLLDARRSLSATHNVFIAPRWGTHSPSRGTSELPQQQQLERHTNIMNVLESSSFTPADLDWGRSVTADPYRSQDSIELWSRPLRQKQQRELQDQQQKEREAISGQEEQEERHIDPTGAMTGASFGQHQPNDHVSPITRGNSAENEHQHPQSNQRDGGDSPNNGGAPTTAPNTAREYLPQHQLQQLAQANDNSAAQRSQSAPTFVHPADLLAMRAKSQASNINHQQHHHHDDSALSAAGASTAASFALDSLRTGEAQAIVAVASGTARNSDYAIDTTLSWLLRTSHGPMLGLEQALLQRDFTERTPPRSLPSASPPQQAQRNNQQQPQHEHQQQLNENGSMGEVPNELGGGDSGNRGGAAAAGDPGATEGKTTPTSSAPPSPNRGIKGKAPLGKPPIASPAGKAGVKTVAGKAAASAAASGKKAAAPAGKSSPAGKQQPAAAAPPPGRARGKSLIESPSERDKKLQREQQEQQEQREQQQRLDAAALSRLSLQGPTGGAEKQAVAAAIVPPPAQASVGSGQIVEDEDEAMRQLERNSDYNPHVDVASSRRSVETDSLRQLHNLLGGVQASMTRDPGAPPLNPDEIDDSSSRHYHYNRDGQRTGGGSARQSDNSGQHATGVLHALHRALQQEARERASSGRCNN